MTTAGQSRARSLALLAGTVSIVLISLLGFLQWRQARAEVDLQIALGQSHLRQRSVGHYLSLLQDMETGHRGYLVTGNPEFLRPFQSASRQLSGAAGDLVELFPPDDPSRRDALELARIGQARARHSTNIVRLWAARDNAAALDRVRSGEGQRLMDAARSTAARLRQREERLSRTLLLESNAGRNRQQKAIILSELALLLALLLMVTAMFRAVRFLEISSASLRDSATRQSAIFEGASDAMLMLDAAGNIEATNAAAERLFGRDRTAMEGQSNLMLFADPPSTEERAAYLRALAAGKPDAKRYFLGRKGDGTLVEAEVVTTPISLEDGLHYLAVARDATDRRRTERMKSEFVATVSHELRTPLTSISGSLGLLSGGAVGELPAKAMRLVEIAYNNCERLIRLINDILDIEKIESGKMGFDLKPIAIGSLIEQAVQSNNPVAARHDVRIFFQTLSPDMTVVADPDRLMQVMTNLLSNAIKFSPGGGAVVVSVSQVAERARITVSDQGPGIDEEFQTRIFSKFAQADSTDTRKKGGTGLGLSIVRELVTRMGGGVSFDTSAGQGTSFHVDLPLEIPAVPDLTEAGPADALPLPAASGDRTRILHVDDDPDTLRLIASAFEGEVEIHSTPSVQEARAALSRATFDAVILDIAMADGDGLALVPLIRKTSPESAIILFTALDSDPGRATGVDAHLTKSRSNLSELVETVTSLIGRQSGKEEGP